MDKVARPNLSAELPPVKGLTVAAQVQAQNIPTILQARKLYKLRPASHIAGHAMEEND